MVKIEVLGTGCAKCKSLAKNVEKAVAEAGVEAEIVKVESLSEIMNRGVMMTPALFIDGEAVAVGRAPSVAEIKGMLKRWDFVPKKEEERKEEEGCLCASSGDLLFLACAEGSNVGQISNNAAMVLAKDGKGKLFCLAGIGAHIDAMILPANERKLVTIDGCPVQCAKKILDHAGLPVVLSVVVTDLEIEKTPKLEVDTADCEKVVEKIKEGLRT